MSGRVERVAPLWFFTRRSARRRIELCRDPDDMPRALAIGAHLDLFHAEFRLAKPAREIPIGGRRPDGENAARAQRASCRLKSPRVVKPVIGRARQAFRAI